MPNRTPRTDRDGKPIFWPTRTWLDRTTLDALDILKKGYTELGVPGRLTPSVLIRRAVQAHAEAMAEALSDQVDAAAMSAAVPKYGDLGDKSRRRKRSELVPRIAL